MDTKAPTTGSIYQSLPPDVLAQLLQGGVLQDQGSLLDQEIAQLLGEPATPQQHSTAMGAGLGGLGEALDKTGNSFLVSALRKQRGENLGQQSQLVGKWGELLRPPAASEPTPIPFSF
jgi:hypothetical protein